MECDNCGKQTTQYAVFEWYNFDTLKLEEDPWNKVVCDMKCAQTLIENDPLIGPHDCVKISLYDIPSDYRGNLGSPKAPSSC